jgi:hypothetical protein
MAGFSLVELMLSLSFGLALSGVMLQGLMAEGQNGARFSRLLRERAAQSRALELVQNDLLQSTAVSRTPELEQHACSLAGRKPVMHLSTAAGPISYSVGVAPSRIWRGQVLMRCGPAYGLDGRLTHASQSNNRVLIDALAHDSQSDGACENIMPVKAAHLDDLQEISALPFLTCISRSSEMLALKINQRLGPSDLGRGLNVSSSRVMILG